MRFLSVFRTVETHQPPSRDLVERMNALIEKMQQSGELIATEGCLPSALGARVRSNQGKVAVTDGPFAETKEVIGGFAILEAASKEEAIRMAREFLAVAGDGECEIRQIFTTAHAGTSPEHSCVQHAEVTDQYSRA